MTAPVAASWLFVPGSRPDRFAKAARAGAGEVVVDLEDAVAPEDKESARHAAVAWLAGGATAWVRVNAANTEWHEADLAALAPCRGLRGVMVPKTEGPAVLRQAARRLPADTGIVALVESALGVQDAGAIAACPAVTALAFGSIDFALDIGAEHTDEALLFARGALVVASRAASLPAPIDGVTVELRDTAAVGAAAARARSLGFGGKLCIHPAQVEPVNAVFAPRGADVEWARAVLAEALRHGGGVFTDQGRMVDQPVLERARRILAQAGRQGGTP
ncbi:HpcH/HpaI aldolase/citrate lyase family protein [Dactylosporangium sp. CA-092794]|uniref:HpcH/HpaI aldolase/citrate lyase family protein n=1 Tax=Dactylosporangium sp. CA-092794 TaxID=3239929 RepID=UPI003D8E5F99